MIKQVYVCDRCGEEIRNHVYQIRAVVRDEKGDYKSALDNQEKMHLCEKCMLDIMDGIYPDNKKPEIKAKEPTKGEAIMKAIREAAKEKPAETKSQKKAKAKPKKIIGIEKNTGKGYGEPNMKDGLDIGKILALSDAGRSDEWIAEEMGVTTSTIAAVLDR